MSDVSAGERLTDVIFSNRLTKKDFAARLGYNPSYITQICLNVKPMTREFALKVEKCFGVAPEWLLYGKSPDAPVRVERQASPYRQALASKVAQIESDAELRAVLAFIKCYEELHKAHAPGISTRLVALNDKPKLFSVPIKGVVAGGAPIAAYEEKDEAVETPIFADSALYIKGASMEPDYPDGSLLLIKENAYISNGDVVIALIMREAEVAEATCKIFHKKKGKITLSPINPAFSEQSYEGKDVTDIRIFGKVIGTAPV